MKKLALGLAALATSATIAPAVFAAGGENYGTVSNITFDTCGESTEGAIAPSPNAKEVTITFSELCLESQEQQEGTGTYDTRPEGYGWIGFKMTAPEDITDEKVTATTPMKKVVYKDALDSESDEKVVTFWQRLDAKMLEEYTQGKDLTTHTFTYTFDWNATPEDPSDDQTVNLVIDTTKITLKKGETTEFSPEKAEEIIAAREAENTLPETPAETTEDTTNPNTADPVALYATIAALAVAGLGATAVIAKKSRR